MIYASLSANGTPAAFYIEGINPDKQIPGDAVQISQAAWKECLEHPGQRAIVNGEAVPFSPPPTTVAAVAPDNPTLGDWRVGLLLWGRSNDVLSAVNALRASGNPLGAIAKERMEYSNNVLRAELMQLRSAFGFSEADVEESLWRAYRVSVGDLSGVWPL